MTKDMEKVVAIRPLHDPDAAKRDREYWMSKTPAERVDAIEYLIRQFYGRNVRLERVLRVVKRERG